jgi:hypothetical protein
MRIRLKVRGDWRSKLVLLAQIVVGLVALFCFLAFTTKQPLLLLAFAFTVPVMVGGVGLFLIVVIFAQRALVEEQYGPGEVILTEGEEGRHVYVVKSGRVEVIRRKKAGGTEVIAQLGPGAHFGELALLGKTPRTATIRTLEDTVVYKMGRGHFAALYTSLSGVQEQFNREMKARLADLETRRAAE